MTERLYRFYDGPQYADGSLSFECRTFDVLKRTPKGAWIKADLEYNGAHGDNKFVLNPNIVAFEAGGDPGRRFAYPTEQMALYSYHKRKERHVIRLRRQLDKAMRLKNALEKKEYRPPISSTKPRDFVYVYHRVTDGRDEELKIDKW